MFWQSLRFRLTAHRPFDFVKSRNAALLILLLVPAVVIAAIYIAGAGTLIGQALYDVTGYGISPDRYRETHLLMRVDMLVLLVLNIAVFGQIVILPCTCLGVIVIEALMRFGPPWLISAACGFGIAVLSDMGPALQWHLGNPLWFGPGGALMGLFYCWHTAPPTPPAKTVEAE